MIHQKRLIFWGLLIVFAASSLVWFFTVPYRPGALYRVIPPNALFVSHHKQLADRWDEFVENPLARTLVASAGLDEAELTQWRDDPETGRWLNKLIERDLLLAHTPALGPTNEPAWVIAGWIGGESIRVRWMLERGGIGGVEKIRRHAGGSYWMVDTGEENGEYLSVGVVEGMLIGAFSRDPHAVRHVLDLFDGLATRHPLFGGDEFNWGDYVRDEAPDHGWFEGPDISGERASYFFHLDQIDGHGMAGSISTEADGELAVMEAADIEIAARFFGSVPFALVGGHPEAAYALTMPHVPASVRRVFQGLYETGMQDALLLAVSGGNYAGTSMGISVPALTLAWPVADETAALQRVQDLFDELNAAYQWGVVAGRERVLDTSVYVIESATDTPYARFRSPERIAYTVMDGWFFVSSHAAPLMRLVERYHGPEALFDADEGGWQDAVRQGNVALSGHVNIQGGARTLRLAISAWSIKLLFDDPTESRETRQRLNEARAWIDTLEPLAKADLWLEEKRGQLRLGFRVGEIVEGDGSE